MCQITNVSKEENAVSDVSALVQPSGGVWGVLHLYKASSPHTLSLHAHSCPHNPVWCGGVWGVVGCGVGCGVCCTYIRLPALTHSPYTHTRVLIIRCGVVGCGVWWGVGCAALI